jgi:hypothetical protein
MRLFLKFNHIYLIPIWIIILFYIIPSALGVFSMGNPNAYQLFLLSIFAIFSYYLSYNCLNLQKLSDYLSKIKKIEGDWKKWAWVIFSIYFAVIFYACINAPQIALIASFKGASISDLSVLREQFLRTESGLGKIPLYIYTICITSIVPLLITQIFLTQKRTRFLILGLFVLSLILTLEKGRALVGMLPLIVWYANKGNLKKAYTICAVLILVIGMVSVVARGGFTNSNTSSTPDKMAGVPDKYNLFSGKTSQFYYIINRVLYIPYMTAIDWLDYREQILNNEKIYGRSIGLIARIMGWEKIYLEKEVFTFEWGQNLTGTGSANTAYYIDAYLNFGLWGIALYSCILAIIIKFCIASQNEALMSTLGIPLYYVCFHGLSAILFSGGLFFLLLIALFGIQKDTSTLKKYSEL